LHIVKSQKAGLEKNIQALTDAISNEREKVLVNEKKALTYDRLEKKYVELEKFNKEIQSDVEKTEAEKKARIAETNELKLKLQERDLEWNKLKRMEADYKSLQEAHRAITQINDKK
jgi:hypothetical protein